MARVQTNSHTDHTPRGRGTWALAVVFYSDSDLEVGEFTKCILTDSNLLKNYNRIISYVLKLTYLQPQITIYKKTANP